MESVVPVVVITGTIGVGKTTVATAMSEILHERGIRHGILEVDWLGEVYPAPYPDDPYSTSFAMQNLAAIWPNYLEVGITRAIVTMTLENHQELEGLRTALSSPNLTVVRLEASTDTRAARIKHRELGNLLNLFLEKTDPLAAKMKRFGIGDLVVDNDHRTPQEVAEEVLTSIGWI
ncbi:MAG: AAA family ATPase [Actinomycetota bacterium]